MGRVPESALSPCFTLPATRLFFFFLSFFFSLQQIWPTNGSFVLQRENLHTYVDTHTHTRTRTHTHKERRKSVGVGWIVGQKKSNASTIVCADVKWPRFYTLRLNHQWNLLKLLKVVLFDFNFFFFYYHHYINWNLWQFTFKIYKLTCQVCVSCIQVTFKEWSDASAFSCPIILIIHFVAPALWLHTPPLCVCTLFLTWRDPCDWQKRQCCRFYRLCTWETGILSRFSDISFNSFSLLHFSLHLSPAPSFPF